LSPPKPKGRTAKGSTKKTKATRRPSPDKRGEKVEVRLTTPAVGDLERLVRLDPQIVRWALKKMLLIERDPFAGEPLRGKLTGWRKLVVGDRDWRVVWRVVAEDTDTVTVDVGEIWAAAARSDDEVYEEMNERVAQMKESPTTVALAEVIQRLGEIAAGLAANTTSDPTPEPVPDWLKERLHDQVGLDAAQIDELDLEQAVDTWTAWQTRPR
jgi:mRNA interferase RelE/StbE